MSAQDLRYQKIYKKKELSSKLSHHEEYYMEIIEDCASIAIIDQQKDKIDY